MFMVVGDCFRFRSRESERLFLLFSALTITIIEVSRLEREKVQSGRVPVMAEKGSESARRSLGIGNCIIVSRDVEDTSDAQVDRSCSVPLSNS